MLVADRKVVLGSLTLYISSPETYRAASLLVEFPKKKWPLAILVLSHAAQSSPTSRKPALTSNV
jgi:hypothetical protein